MSLDGSVTVKAHVKAIVKNLLGYDLSAVTSMRLTNPAGFKASQSHTQCGAKLSRSCTAA